MSSIKSAELYDLSFTRNFGIITREEQARLRNARVTVVGAGGVGGITLIQLARMGVGKIHVIDQDSFEASNINRQMLSFVSKINSPKAEVAKEILLDINPELNVEVTSAFVTEENALELLTDTDVIVDATDNLVARVIIHRAAAKLGIPSIWIAVTPPFRGGVMCMTPDSVPYEVVLRHPSYQQPLTPDMCDQINKIKDERAKYSVSQGALPEWADAYLKKDAPWAVLAPVANIVGVLASFEAFKLIIKRPDLKPTIAPSLVKINLASSLMVQVETPAEGSWDNALL
ncbi:molybdopterin biosynthesis protein MoeB [Brevibacillus parabrevis]|uniref:HesA/MoeB/ThiF family protein n=1 Tax=Brevibacillus parabrevis TaxID=54914 RepID=UPI0007AB3625|nr:ThiF family adenylyltransferase [Brevibacillus parabrevis]KZE46588.1 molybdopterin biosynthesis protein MoeB [Brevibacillus parabrevis]